MAHFYTVYFSGEVTVVAPSPKEAKIQVMHQVGADLVDQLDIVDEWEEE